MLFGKRIRTHELPEMCTSLQRASGDIKHGKSLGELTMKVTDLAGCCISSEALRYPDIHRYPSIPNDVYGQRADYVMQLTQEILQIIKSFILTLS